MIVSTDDSPVTVPIDKFYLSGWKITFICICLFSGLSNVAAIVLRYRLKVKNTGDFATKQIMFIRKYEDDSYEGHHYAMLMLYFQRSFLSFSLD